MRDYRAMRWILSIVADATGAVDIGDFMPVGSIEEVGKELERLRRDGLVDGTFAFNSSFAYTGGTVSGLTEEGEGFYRLVENERVWSIILKTLDNAGIDISYPLLKEVCEEIVKRYVTSFIPNIK